MTPSKLAGLYSVLRQRVNLHVEGACAEVSVQLPPAFDGELAFFRLVNWSYVVFNEAGRVALPFLANLPPLREAKALKAEVGYLRAYVVHNLDVTRKHDAKMVAATHRWFKTACGKGYPTQPAHFADACTALCVRFAEMLVGAIDACDLLDGDEDGLRLVEDLRARIDLNWEAHRFDRFVERCAERIGNVGLDLLKLRANRLDEWRKTVAAAEEVSRERALELRIEADLLAAIGDTLPVTAAEAATRLALAGPERVVAALLILRRARANGGLFIPALIETAVSMVEDENLQAAQNEVKAQSGGIRP